LAGLVLQAIFHSDFYYYDATTLNVQ